ncbi:MAG: autotransporter assembly complex family protein [Thiotrichales bacterium]
MKRWSGRVAALLALGSAGLASATPQPGLSITGVDGAVRDNIAAYLDVSGYRCEQSRWRLRRLTETSQDRAGEALRAFGHYSPTLAVDTRQDEDCWTLVVTVDPGPEVTLGEVEVAVSGELGRTREVRALLAQPTLRPGAPLRHAEYDGLKNEIEALAQRFGYFEGRYTEHRLEVDPERAIANIRLRYEAGTRSRFGEVTLHQEQFDSHFVESFLTLRPGTPYDSRLLARQQVLLGDTGYFSEIDIDIDTRASAAEDHDIPVDIRLTPAKRSLQRIGIGASTDVGPRLSYRFNHRWFNRQGHFYKFSTGVAPVRQEVIFDYAIPLGDLGRTRLDLKTGFQAEDTATFDSKTLKFGAYYTQALPRDWTRSFFVEYLSEDFRTADTERRVDLLMPGIRLQRIRSDHPLFPSRGYRLFLKVQGGVEGILSDLDVVQATANLKLIEPLGKGRVLARGGAGTTKVPDFERFPASLRFFAGGDGSVRGYAFKSLGPEQDGEVIGGRHLLTGSLEFEYPVRDRWSVAAFTDVGNAFDTFADYELRSSVGVGVRWRSPIGPVRLDLAYGLERDSGIRLHLSMGPDL